MNPKPLHILLIADDPGDARLMLKLVAESAKLSGVINQVARLSEGIYFLAKQTVDVVLLDLGLPDEQGLATMEQMRSVAESTPVIVLIDHDDPVFTLEVIKAGAQDYLIVGQITVDSLERSIRYALERYRAQHRIRESEQFLSATLDSFSRHIAILDSSGEIILANRGWIDFAKPNQTLSPLTSGVNYLTLCDAMAAEGDGLAAILADSIRAVANGSVPRLHFEFKSQNDGKDCWYDLRLTTFPGPKDRRVVVDREDITARKKTKRIFAEAKTYLRRSLQPYPWGCG